jgi:hypothetical protein
MGRAIHAPGSVQLIDHHKPWIIPECGAKDRTQIYRFAGAGWRDNPSMITCKKCRERLRSKHCKAGLAKAHRVFEAHRILYAAGEVELSKRVFDVHLRMDQEARNGADEKWGPR